MSVLPGYVLTATSESGNVGWQPPQGGGPTAQLTPNLFEVVFVNTSGTWFEENHLYDGMQVRIGNVIMLSGRITATLNNLPPGGAGSFGIGLQCNIAETYPDAELVSVQGTLNTDLGDFSSAQVIFIDYISFRALAPNLIGVDVRINPNFVGPSRPMSFSFVAKFTV
jgi:hypothetical protein